MKKNKALLALVCAVLLVVATICGTLAYFTDQEAVVNTFTVGNVEIDLNESDFDNDNNTKQNDYHLQPGLSYTKDPVVTLKAGSEESYVRMIVTVENYEKLKAAFPKDKEFGGKKVYEDWYLGEGENEVFLLQKLVKGWEPAKWECVAISADGVYEFRYTEKVAAPTADVKLPPLFTEVVIPGSVNNTELANLQNFDITIVAHAIQTAGFETDVNAAWAAFDNQHPAEPEEQETTAPPIDEAPEW